MAALLPLAALAGFAVLSALAAFQTEDRERLQTAARMLAATVDAELGAKIVALRVLADSPDLNDEIAAQAFLSRFHRSGILPCAAILLLGPPDQAARVTSSRSDAHDRHPAAGPDMAEALREPLSRVFASRQPIVSDLIPSAGDTPYVIAALVPVIRDAEVRQALALILDPKALYPLLARLALEDGSLAAMGDSRLRQIAHSFDPDGRSIGRAAPDWMVKATAGRAEGLISGRAHDGREMVYAFTRPRQAPGWAVGVSDPISQQQAAAWRALQWMLAGGAALGLGLAAAVWASRRDALNDARRQADLLRAGRAEVLRLLGGLPIVVFHSELRRDGSSHLLFRSGDFEGVTGWPATEMFAQDAIGRRVYPGDMRLEDVAETLWRDGQVYFHRRMLQPDGGVRWLRTRVRVIERHGGDRMEVVGSSVNVTAEREAEARALSAARLASLGEMAAGLAHELKQPLQSMMLAADIALLATARQDHAEVVRRLETIIGQAQRAGDLIERVRRSARGGVNKGNIEDVPLAAAVEGALLLSGGRLADASVTVEIALGEPPPVIRGETVLLEQVLANLLLNAADALSAQPADKARRIWIASEPAADGMVRLTVADNGGGIAPEVLAHIFEPFVTTKGPDKGTGLGLSICHGLITGMGGRIEARNEAAGAVFTLTLVEAAMPQQA